MSTGQVCSLGWVGCFKGSDDGWPSKIIDFEGLLARTDSVGLDSMQVDW